MKDYLEHFTIVWSGAEPLLPPRRSKPPRWWTMGGHTTLVDDHDPKEIAKLKDGMRERRAYTRRGAAAPAGQPSTTGAGAGGLSPESLPNPTHHSTTTQGVKDSTVTETRK